MHTNRLSPGHVSAPNVYCGVFARRFRVYLFANGTSKLFFLDDENVMTLTALRSTGNEPAFVNGNGTPACREWALFRSAAHRNLRLGIWITSVHRIPRLSAVYFAPRYLTGCDRLGRGERIMAQARDQILRPAILRRGACK
jgi:hypothetical protein